MAKSVLIYSDLPETGYLRLAQVLRFIPIGRSSWYAGIKDGRYPRPIRIGPKTAVYRAEDIRQLLAELDKQAED